MIFIKILPIHLFLVILFCSLDAVPLADELNTTGYIELHDTNHGSTTFDMLYKYFDELINFLQTNPMWAQKLYIAKEQFIRTSCKKYYSTDFFGFYDESHKHGRNQISFYYSSHFHEFICFRFPQFNEIPQLITFFNACRELESSYAPVFENAANELGLTNIFKSDTSKVPILLKVVKYLAAYSPTRPHYDGTAFSLFLDSTDNQSLLLSPYKLNYTIADFSCPQRIFLRQETQNSIILIPGAFLTEFGINPTPHIVTHSNKERYATIAFAMKPNHITNTNTLSPLPLFKR